MVATYRRTMCTTTATRSHSTQVLPAWRRGMPKKLSVDADAAEFVQHQLDRAEFVKGRVELQGKRPHDVERIANMHYMKALDHTLGFSFFAR